MSEGDEIVVELLKTFNVFRELGTPALEEIVRISLTCSIRAGDCVFTIGDDATRLFIVNTGEVELRFPIYHLNAPVDLTLDTMRKGDMFGWSAFAGGTKYTLTACATNDTQLIEIPAEKIKQLCEVDPHLGYILMNNISTIISSRFIAIQGLLRHIIQGNLE